MICKLKLIIFFSILPLAIYGQKKNFVGVWKCEINEDVFKVFKEESYWVFNERNSYLMITCISDTSLSVSINSFCFTVAKDKNGCKDCISDFNLHENFQLCFNKNSSPSGFEFSDDGKSMVIINVNEFYYSKVERLPNKYIGYLLRQSRKNKINYIREFLAVNYKLIKNKTYLHSSKYRKTDMYLLQNDPVEVIEENDNWLKIIYYPEKNDKWTGKTIEGWIKRSDVE
ncbi:SH3 domain-containing protein [Cellulophaga sp. BC115SP]|uniref:SH3 domain-containing protein n=1 Tax=Cellulophaga sp. BC115SP TaxID=2683263 RepID=UPI00141341A1|nr:SH3 domain-containing protein [Cellulophaga sp. BC115SP]NBB32014.1 hypothetical protein [Cellulophaga sp. BC115SP]